MKNLIVLLFMSFIVLGMNAQEIDLTKKKKTDAEKAPTAKVNNIDDSNSPYEYWYENWKYEEAIPLQNKDKQIVVKTVNKTFVGTSSSIEVGKNYYLFKVVKAKDTTLIGKRVACQVIERRKSNISGSEGRLRLLPLYVENGDQQIPLVPNEIYRRGLNISNVKFWLSFLVIPLFMPGTGAKIAPNEKIVMTLAG